MKIVFLALAMVSYFGSCDSAMVTSGSLDVTLVVFSGVPDPQWMILPNSGNYQKINELLKAAKNSRATYLPEQMPAQLGYKGFLVLETGQENPSLILGPQTTELQQQLLQSIPAGKPISKSLKDQLSVVIRGGKVQPVDLKDVEKPITKRAAPNYEGATLIWNHNYARPRNNCYNYANDKVTNSFAQPGRGSGQMYAAVNNNEVRAASRRDGLLKVEPGNGGAIPTVPPNGPRHLVALVVDPNVDFHWYRLDSNGQWSHKPGETRITNKDGAGALIPDPRLAANSPGGPNYQFVCFMTTDKNTVTIQ